MESFCPLVKIHCENAGSGCTFFRTRAVYENTHKNQCPFDKVKCRLKCGSAAMFRKDLELHEKQECPKRQLECDSRWCGFRGTEAALEEHRKTDKCILFPITCPNPVCNKSLPAVQLGRHLRDSECGTLAMVELTTNLEFYEKIINRMKKTRDNVKLATKMTKTGSTADIYSF
eukprot:1774236-Rhodomonas_salina.1